IRIQQSTPQRIVFAEGEEEEVIIAAMSMRDASHAHPILVGRYDKISAVLNRIGMNYDLDGITIMNAAINQNLDKYIDTLYSRYSP
ncbi:phosphate acyltransferase, partial [Klebsiella pneumoniae]|uniref:phosphate acyltransferase n=1 Tax=Klebsiella pneumoniae TaxID=573 RepID=UPI0040558665